MVRHVMFIALVLGALVLSGCGGRSAQQPPAAPTQPTEGQKVKVAMSEFKFALEPAEAKAGQVVFEVENVGTVEHSFIIEAAGVKSEQIQPGQKVTVETDLKPGTYTVVCDVVGHKEAGMTMELVVR